MRVIKGVHLHSLLFLLLVTVSLAGLLQNRNIYDHKKSRDIHFAWPAGFIEHLVLGVKLPMADFFWVRLIQDMGYKENEKTNKLGWVYRMYDAITNLDHRYRIVYVAGGTMLSVEVDDAEGAARLLEKGITYMPHDWSLLYRAGYHFLYELHDCKKAAYYLNEAGKYGAPVWVASLASRLYTATAQYMLALSVIDDNLKRFENIPVMVKNLQQRKDELLKAMRGQKVTGTPATQLCH